MKIGVWRAGSPRETAETTTNEANVGEIDVAIDDVGDSVAHGFAAQGVCHRDQSIECGAFGVGEAQALLERKLNPVAGRGETVTHVGGTFRKRGKGPKLCRSP